MRKNIISIILIVFLLQSVGYSDSNTNISTLASYLKTAGPDTVDIADFGSFRVPYEFVAVCINIAKDITQEYDRYLKEEVTSDARTLHMRNILRKVIPKQVSSDSVFNICSLDLVEYDPTQNSYLIPLLADDNNEEAFLRVYLSNEENADIVIPFKDDINICVVKTYRPLNKGQLKVSAVHNDEARIIRDHFGLNVKFAVQPTENDSIKKERPPP